MRHRNRELTANHTQNYRTPSYAINTNRIFLEGGGEVLDLNFILPGNELDSNLPANLKHRFRGISILAKRFYRQQTHLSLVRSEHSDGLDTTV